LTADDVIEIAGRLRRASIEFWIEGGWGIDALLGRQTRLHDDLDLGVRMNDMTQLEETLVEFRRSDAEWPSAVVFEDGAGRKVDTHPLTFDESGDGWQADAKGGARHKWPRDGLTGRGCIANLDVPCITAELRVQWHLYPEFDDVDWRDLQLVCGRFGLEVPDECREAPGFVAPKRNAAKSAMSDV
jgi:lincosamide nucleotidyltransferase A/C/D/E